MADMIERIAEALANKRGQSLATATRAFRLTCWDDALVAIEALRDLGDDPGPRYAAGEYSRRNVEAIVDDALARTTP